MFLHPGMFKSERTLNDSKAHLYVNEKVLSSLLHA